MGMQPPTTFTSRLSSAVSPLPTSTELLLLLLAPSRSASRWKAVREQLTVPMRSVCGTVSVTVVRKAG